MGKGTVQMGEWRSQQGKRLVQGQAVREGPAALEPHTSMADLLFMAPQPFCQAVLLAFVTQQRPTEAKLFLALFWVSKDSSKHVHVEV